MACCRGLASPCTPKVKYQYKQDHFHIINYLYKQFQFTNKVNVKEFLFNDLRS